jgi:hypothetical protein
MVGLHKVHQEIVNVYVLTAIMVTIVKMHLAQLVVMVKLVWMEEQQLEVEPQILVYVAALMDLQE